VAGSARCRGRLEGRAAFRRRLWRRVAGLERRSSAKKKPVAVCDGLSIAI